METIASLLSSQPALAQLDVRTFIIDAVILLAISTLLAFVYTKCAQTLSNRKQLAALFPLLALTTMMIIAIIKSSIALSLGLVGALSIVRFRSAIKEPEELAYIFLTISLGLGMGAGQRTITLVFYALIMAFVVVRFVLKNNVRLFNRQSDTTMYLELASSQDDVKLSLVVPILEKHCDFIDIKRVDDDGANKKLLFAVAIKNPTTVEALQTNLAQKFKKTRIMLLNDEGLFS